MPLYKNYGRWKTFDCLFGFRVKSYVTNTIILSWDKILLTSVIEKSIVKNTHMYIYTLYIYIYIYNVYKAIRFGLKRTSSVWVWRIYAIKKIQTQNRTYFTWYLKWIFLLLKLTVQWIMSLSAASLRFHLCFCKMNTINLFWFKYDGL
jgi:hypothetical protein